MWEYIFPIVKNVYSVYFRLDIRVYGVYNMLIRRYGYGC